jgi:hypothetical protein
MKTNPPPSRPPVFVRLFAEEAAIVLGSHCGAARCVNATRVCLDAMRAFHVRAEALSVDAILVNAAWLELTANLGRGLNEGPSSPEELEVFQRRGAWAVGIDTKARSTDNEHNVWPGHLVAVVQKEWIIDGAAVQMSRPTKGMHLPDVFVGYAPRNFLRGRDRATYASGEGARLVYEARVKDRSWETLSGFQCHEHNATMTHEIVARMNTRLGK